MSGASSFSVLEDLESERAWPTLLGQPGKAKQRPPSVWDHIPYSVVAPLTVMTKGKAAPKSSTSPKVTPKWSPKFNHGPMSTPTAAAADLDPLPEPQQPAQEAVLGQEHKDAKEESDAGHSTSQKSDEKMEDKHEKEDKHEEKTEPNGSNASNASTTSQDLEPIPRQESSSEHGEGRGDVESASSAAAEPTPVPEIAQAKEAPQAETKDPSMWPPLGASAPKVQHMEGWPWGRRAPASIVAAKRNPELTPLQKQQQRQQQIAQGEAQQLWRRFRGRRAENCGK